MLEASPREWTRRRRHAGDHTRCLPSGGCGLHSSMKARRQVGARHLARARGAFRSARFGRGQQYGERCHPPARGAAWAKRDAARAKPDGCPRPLAACSQTGDRTSPRCRVHPSGRATRRGAERSVMGSRTGRRTDDRLGGSRMTEEGLRQSAAMTPVIAGCVFSASSATSGGVWTAAGSRPW